MILIMIKKHHNRHHGHRHHHHFEMSTPWIFKNLGMSSWKCWRYNLRGAVFFSMVFYLQLLQIERRHRNFLVVLRFFVKIVRITHQFTKDILCIYTINCTFEYIDICVYIFTSRKINYKVPTSCIGKGPLLPNLGITPSTQCISLRPQQR